MAIIITHDHGVHEAIHERTTHFVYEVFTPDEGVVWTKKVSRLPAKILFTRRINAGQLQSREAQKEVKRVSR